MSTKYEEVPKEQEQKAQFVDGRQYGLPVGWVVELRPRTNPKYKGKVDQFFYQPVTNKKFRSLKSAMAEGTEANNIDNLSQASSSKPGSSTEKHTEAPVFNFLNPPKMVTWVLDDAESDGWKPHIQGVELTDRVKDLWRQTFDKCPSNNK